MINADEIILIAENQPDGAFDERTETRHRVYCNVRSVGMRENYEAHSAGLDPELVFVLSDIAEYAGEMLAEYHGTRYRVVRTYVTQTKVELTVERILL